MFRQLMKKLQRSPAESLEQAPYQIENRPKLDWQPLDVSRLNLTGQRLRQIEASLKAREAARQRQDWQAADQIRHDLAAQGIEIIDDQTVEVLRQRGPAGRLEIAFGMWRSAREIITAIVASQHPDWSQNEVAAEVARRLSHGAC